MNIEEMIGLSPVIPVLTVTDPDHAVPLARALLAGGLRVLEIALCAPASIACLQRIREAVPEAIVGAGTLTKPVDFAAAGRAGAHFGVAPGLIPELAAAARGARFPLLPSVMTPSELLAARQAGFRVLKLFPAHQAGGIGMLHSLQAAFADALFCPTGGITQASAPQYLSLSNVLSVGGSWVAPPELIDAQNWPCIEALAREAASLTRGRSG